MKFFVSAHIRREDHHKLVGISAGIHEAEEWDYSGTADGLQDMGTLARFASEIEGRRKAAGKINDGLYVHILSINPLPAHSSFGRDPDPDWFEKRSA